MSAFLCSEYHFNVLANAYPVDDAESMFRVLVDQNMRSMRARYSDIADEEASAAAYRYRPMADVREAIQAAVDKWFAKYPHAGTTFAVSNVDALTQIVKLADCFGYQACETDDYEKTEAAAFVATVRQFAIAQGGKTKGSAYDRMLWGF